MGRSVTALVMRISGHMRALHFKIVRSQIQTFRFIFTGAYLLHKYHKV